MFRGDSGFYRNQILSWCDRNNVDYIVGISKNSRLLKEVDVPMVQVRTTQWQVKEKVAGTFRFRYQVRSWKYPRWALARLEEGELGSNPGFIISSRYDNGFRLYYEQYPARDDMENRIKDQQPSLFADRTSSAHWWSNRWRLILPGFAYTLFERLRAHLAKRFAIGRAHIIGSWNPRDRRNGNWRRARPDDGLSQLAYRVIRDRLGHLPAGISLF